jgi:two-component system LytT family response regulator
MKILIVDDENLAISRLRRLLNQNGFENITSFEDSSQALKDIYKNSYDVVFLDISMPKIDGLTLATHISEQSPSSFIVFVTAYNEYALKAYESGGMAYLLKPIDEDDLKSLFSKIKNFISNNNTTLDKKIIGRSAGIIYIVDIDDIYYIKADLDEVIVRVKENELFVKKKIGDLEAMLENKNFFRVHRSYIVNVDKIKSMLSVEQSKLQISFKDIQEVLTSSKDGAKEFREYMEKISL